MRRFGKGPSISSESIIDLAGSFGAPAIIGSMQGRHGDGVDKTTALAYLVEGLHALGEPSLEIPFAAVLRTAQPLRDEPGQHGGRRRTTATALGDGKRQAASRPVPHEHRGSGHPDGDPRGGEAIGHVHFVDSNRRPAGCGHIDFAPIAAALRDIGYDGYSPPRRCRIPNPVEAASLEPSRRTASSSPRSEGAAAC